VFGFILSRTSFQLVYFDRSGAVECMPLDIHLNAVQLVQTIRMMGDRDLSMLGFDPSVYWENGRRYVDVMGRTPGTRKVSLRKYEIEHIIYQRPQLLGSGTTCWVVKAVGGVESVLMKDTWRDEGHNEEEFLTLANKQNILGVVKLHIIDQSRTRTGAPSISSLRHDQHIAVTGNRLFSRLILELQRPSVTHFDSGIHLLRGLRDAVSGTFSPHPNPIDGSLTTFLSTSPSRQERSPSPRHQPREYIAVSAERPRQSLRYPRRPGKGNIL